MGPVWGGGVNGWKRERGKEDVGYWTRECFHLKAESGENETPRRDKGQRVRGRERERERGKNRGEGPRR